MVEKYVFCKKTINVNDLRNKNINISGEWKQKSTLNN